MSTRRAGARAQEGQGGGRAEGWGIPILRAFSRTLSLHERFLSLVVTGKELCEFFKFMFEGVHHFIKHLSASSHGQPEPCRGVLGACRPTSGTEARVQSCPHRHLGRDHPSRANFSRVWCNGLSRRPRLSNFPQNIRAVSEPAPAIPEPARLPPAERLVRKQQLSGPASVGNSRSCDDPGLRAWPAAPVICPRAPF